MSIPIMGVMEEALTAAEFVARNWGFIHTLINWATLVR